MRIAVSSDERTGVAEALVTALRERGHEPLLHGALSEDERGALGVEHRADHLLVLAGPVLVPAAVLVLGLAGPGTQAAGAIEIEAPHALDGVVARPLERLELVQPCERR